MNLRTLGKRKIQKKDFMEDTLMDIVEKQIREGKINKETIEALVGRENLEAAIGYTESIDEDDLLKRYIIQYSYWLNGIEIDGNSLPKENFKKLLIDLIEELYNNELMQKILILELNNTNGLTQDFACHREFTSTTIMQYFSQNADEVEIQPHLALIIGGAYYLILHSKIATFCNIDFSMAQGRELLLNTVDQIVELLFTKKHTIVKENDNSKAKEIATNLLKSGVEKQIILESTGLSVEEFAELEDTL